MTTFCFGAYIVNLSMGTPQMSLAVWKTKAVILILKILPNRDESYPTWLSNCIFRVPLCAKKYYNIVLNVFADWRDEGGRLSGRHRGFRRQVVQPCRGNHSLKVDCPLQTPRVSLSCICFESLVAWLYFNLPRVIVCLCTVHLSIPNNET